MSILPQKLQTDNDFARTVFFLISWLIVGLIAIIFQNPLAWSTAFLMAIASIACGATVGFLFGIPRTDFPRDESNDKDKIQASVKTNLEEIADWLTKILLGAGLTQIGQIPTALQSMASNISAPTDSNIIPITISIWLYFSILGFFLGYLVTRLFLTRALAWADTLVNGRIEVAGESFSLGDVVHDLRKAIADLQDHVVKQNTTTLAPSGQPEDTTTEQAQKFHGLPVRLLLWVDEQPLSEPLLVEKLQSMNITVTHLKPGEPLPAQFNYDRAVLVSTNSNDPAAADTSIINFISNIKGKIDMRNTIIYCTPENKARLESLIDRTCIGGLTSSPVDLLKLLRLSEQNTSIRA